MKVKVGSGCRYNCRKTHVHLAGPDGSINSRFACRSKAEAMKAAEFAGELYKQGFRRECFHRTRLASDWACSRVRGRDIEYFAWSVDDWVQNA